MSPFKMVFIFAWALIRQRVALATENLALRQQLGIERRSNKRPKLRRGDRIFWVWLSKLWPNWRSALVIVKPVV